MANLFNFLTNFKNNMGNNNADPTMEAIQLDDNGNIDAGKSLQLKQETTPLSFADRLLGRKYEMDTIQTDPETGSTTMQTATNFKSGLLNDLDAGLKENYGNDFKVSNLAPDNKKGFAYRFGEGLGTLSKVLAGTGGDAYIAGTQGLDAAMNRQAYRTNDRLYRDALNAQGVDTSNIRGFVSDKAFNQLLTAKQLQDNAEYRNLYLDSQLKNQEEMAKYRQAQLAQQANQDRLDNYYKGQQIAQGWKRLEQNNKPSGNIGNLQAVNQQLQRFEDTFKTMPGKFESNTLGRFRNKTGFQTPAEANFDSQRTLLFNKIARDLGGEKGVLSDQDIKRIEKSLPAYTDSYEQKQAKMRAIYDLLEDRLSVEGGSLNQETDNDPMGIL